MDPCRGEDGRRASDGLHSRKRPHVALEYEGGCVGVAQPPPEPGRVRVKQEMCEQPLTSCQYGLPAHHHQTHSSVKTEPFNGFPSLPSCPVYSTHLLYPHHSLPQDTTYHHFPTDRKPPDLALLNRSLSQFTHYPTHQVTSDLFPFSPWGLASLATPSSVGGASSIVGGATSSLGRAISSMGGATYSVGGASVGGATSSISSIMGGTSVGGATYSVGGATSIVGGANVGGASVGGATFGSLAGLDMSHSLAEGPELGVSASPQQPEVGPRRKGKSPRGPSRVKRELEEDDGWEPPLWRQQLENIIKMRENRDAPVDLMGAHKNAEQTTHVTPKVRRYQVLISLMLSSQTKDQITSQAMQALKTHGLTIENIISTPEEDIAKLIHPVGFWRKKAGYIKRVSQILRDKYGGDIPATMDQLCSLPGVGPKMSHLVMDIAWDNTSGVAVDTHVHRISHRLGWMRQASENPEVTRICIEKWLPKSEWRELNWLLVGFGQQKCLPNAPKCKGCLNEEICPASKLKNGGPWGRKKKAVKREIVETN